MDLCYKSIITCVMRKPILLSACYKNLLLKKNQTSESNLSDGVSHDMLIFLLYL